MTFRESCTWLVRAVTEREPAAPADVARRIAPGPRLSSVERLAIHRSGYLARLVECLEDDYPVVAQVLGSDAFRSLAEAYVERHPSSSPNLNPFGRHFARFCREPGACGSFSSPDFIADLAKLEWAIVEVIHAADAPRLDAAALAALPVDAWARARLVPHDALRIVRTDYPVNAYHRTCRELDEAPPLPPRSPTLTAVYRADWKVWRADVEPLLAPVLEALVGGSPLLDALSRVDVGGDDTESLARTQAQVQRAFREWIGAGWFVRVDV